MKQSTRRKMRLFLPSVVVVLLLAGGILLISQQRPRIDKRPPRPGTIPAMLENPNIQGDIRFGLNVEFPVYQSLDALTDASDAVVRGKVVASRSYPCNDMRFVCTESRLKVEDVLSGSIPANRRGVDRIPTLKDKRTGGRASAATPRSELFTEFEGPGPDEIVVTQAGGALLMNGRRVIASVADQKMLERGREYILFLTWVPENGTTSAGANTYHLTAGPQSAIEVEGDQIHSMLADQSHPVRFEVDRFLKNNRALFHSHLEQRRLGRRP